MAKESDPDSRPITVEELIARTSDENAFPRADSLSVRRAATGRKAASADDSGPTASGMPGYTPPPAKTRNRVVGASGMPAYTPSGDAKRPADSANVVTGIIPVVSGGEDDSDRLDTGELRAVDPDDLLGEDLPSGGQPADDRASRTDTGTIPAAAAAVGAAGAGTDEGDETAVADAADGFDDFDDNDDAEGGDHLASSDELEAAQRADAETAESATDTDEDSAADRSPIWSWLGLIGEVILGVAVGAGLFWGFTVLWKQYVYFALILAVLVIFAIVTFAYVLRKRDLPTTLLALAVGLIVTIGPLVLLV
ncbi:hypothetical protein [Gordonia caeni]